MFINGHMKLVILATSDDESIILFKRIDDTNTLEEFIVATNVKFSKFNHCKWSYASYYGSLEPAMELFKKKTLEV